MTVYSDEINEFLDRHPLLKEEAYERVETDELYREEFLNYDFGLKKRSHLGEKEVKEHTLRMIGLLEHFLLPVKDISEEISEHEFLSQFLEHFTTTFTELLYELIDIENAVRNYPGVSFDPIRALKGVRRYKVLLMLKLISDFNVEQESQGAILKMSELLKKFSKVFYYNIKVGSNKFFGIPFLGLITKLFIKGEVDIRAAIKMFGNAVLMQSSQIVFCSIKGSPEAMPYNARWRVLLSLYEVFLKERKALSKKHFEKYIKGSTDYKEHNHYYQNKLMDIVWGNKRIRDTPYPVKGVDLGDF